jgi:hypothetical protein
MVRIPLPPSARDLTQRNEPLLVQEATAFVRREFNSPNAGADLLLDSAGIVEGTTNQLRVLFLHNYGFGGVTLTLKDDGTVDSVVCQRV